MTGQSVPQPSTDRIVDPRNHPLVVGLVPGQPELVLRTAARWSRTLGAALYCAYADPSRFTVEEFDDGTVRHAPVDPDSVEDSWKARERDIEDFVATVLRDEGVEWHTRYLAGRPDRALTHLARAVDASAFVVGTRAPGVGARVRELVEGSVAVHLSHHQHRPVLVVPLEVVDWKVTVWR
ncbi:universal stress protein [Actinotalea sp. K2]|uniref:universal stress protein n=1 Tax=Actinotalea sp. K2 TaxID=2939438 RepID=UPI00201716A4|nr:universal stress protein [Actinotalea sp. K2]MCL3861120.1 universal stress protein [Actinotalea sp. K2]